MTQIRNKENKDTTQKLKKMSNTDTTKKTGANSRITENSGNMTQIRNKENKDTTQKLKKMSNTDTTKKNGSELKNHRKHWEHDTDQEHCS
jgi:hydrogenase maturation factor